MIVQVKKDNNNEPDNNNSKDSKDNDYKRFEDEGVVFKVKLIGSELVLEPRGDKMCQNSIQRLKAIIKGTNSHKRRVVMKISYDGVKIYDEKTKEILHHHEVSQISFIASDDTDNRTFGYVGDVPNKAHQFVCFKTQGPAINIINVINSLFEAVVEKKKQAEKEKQEEKDKKIISDDDIFGPTTEQAIVVGATTTTTTSANITPTATLSSSASVSAARSAAAAAVAGSATTSSFSSKDKHIADLLDDSGIMTAMTLPSTPIPVQQSSNNNNNNSTQNRSLIYNHSSVSLSDVPLARQTSFTSSSVKNDSFVDRYAVFNDIDNLPSIFESTSLNSVNKMSMNNINSSTGSILEPMNMSSSSAANMMMGPFGGSSKASSMMSSMPKPNSSATIRQIPNFHMAAAHNNFSKSFNTTTSSASSGLVSDISSTSAGTHSTSTLEANMFRRTNPFDDDFFA